MKFSVVIPIKGTSKECELIPITLPSYYAIKPSEVILCLDKPAPKRVVQVIKKVAKLCKAEDITKIIEVERDPTWSFHQAWVRRKGFLEAKYDRILTGDIDLIVNKNVLKSLEMVGKDNIGLVSLSKKHRCRGLSDYWHEGVLLFLRNVLHGVFDKLMVTTTFTGLYAIWRPYWLDSEPEDAVKKLVNPKQFYRGEHPSLDDVSAVTGEDTFLRDQMIKKHKCIYLKDVGAIDMGIATESLPYIQYMKGLYFARQGRSLIVSLGRTVLRMQPYYLKGYLSARRKLISETA